MQSFQARVARKWDDLWQDRAVEPYSGASGASLMALVAGNGNSKYYPKPVDRCGRSSLESFFDVYGDNVGTLDSGNNTVADDTDDDSDDEGCGTE